MLLSSKSHSVRATRAFTSRQTPQIRCVAQQPATGAVRMHLAAASSALLLAGSGLLAPSAGAFGPVSVPLSDITVAKVDCQAGVSSVSGVTFSGTTSKATCLDVTARADNPNKKPLYNADVFGRVYDSNGEAMLDQTENIRVAYIPEVAPGISKVTLRLIVPTEQYDLGPITLKSFKATGFPGKMLPGQGSGRITDDAEVCAITGDCTDLEAEAAIR